MSFRPKTPESLLWPGTKEPIFWLVTIHEYRIRCEGGGSEMDLSGFDGGRIVPQPEHSLRVVPTLPGFRFAKGDPEMTPKDALKELHAGNKRFVAHLHNETPTDNHNRQHELIINQKPIAIIVGCSDARVPPELIFDQGMGDLFVIRVAGNIITRAVLESIEFAALAFGPRLVVVLGHTCCGAVTATVNTLLDPTTNPDKMYPTVIKHVRPSAQAAIDAADGESTEAIVDHTTCHNVHRSMESIVTRSESMKQLMRDEGLMVVGAKYRIEDGGVEFFDE